MNLFIEKDKMSSELKVSIMSAKVWQNNELNKLYNKLSMRGRSRWSKKPNPRSRLSA